MGNSESQSEQGVHRSRPKNKQDPASLLLDKHLRSVFRNGLTGTDLKSLNNCEQEEHFTKLFKFPKGSPLASLLFASFVGTSSSDLLTEQRFLTAANDILQLVNETEFYVKTFAKQKPDILKDELKIMLESVCALACMASGHSIDMHSKSSQSIFSAMINSMMTTGDSMTTAECTQFIWCNCPNMFATLHAWVSSILKGTHSSHKQPPQADLPKDKLLSPALLWLLSISLSGKYTERPHHEGLTSDPLLHSAGSLCAWTLLYDSNDHGLSMNRFEHHVFSYKGATVLLLSLDAQLYCVVCDVEWREAGSRWGGLESAVYRIIPDFHKVETGPDLLYLNQRSRGIPQGIQAGKNSKAPVFYIHSGMDKVSCGVSQNKQDLYKLEVWGCANEKVLEQQREQSAWDKKLAERSQKVKLPGRWEDNPDRQILEMGGVTINHSQRAEPPIDSQ